ncbi:unnamed protein product [Spodoptera exigua]|nr:unnamed protein product [Spodoptera exigua]
MRVLLLLLSLFSASWAEEQQATKVPRAVEMTLGVDMKPPKEWDSLPTRNVFVTWMPMPLDHFDPHNPTIFHMRFMFNEEFFGGDGSPIFILVGGEWDIDHRWLLAGNMYEMARENKGYQIYTEHRYYGATKIFPTFTAENLRFLNIDQALADLAYFIVEMKKQPRFANSKVILYGGSYAANMVMWFKKRYPHLVVGSVASSGPILAKVDFTEYLEVVHEAFLLEGGEQCIAHIKRGIDDTLAAIRTESGRRMLEQAYRLCAPLDYDDIFAMGYFSGLITWSFSAAVQGARPGSLMNICNNFEAGNFGSTPMEQIGAFIALIQELESNECWTITYEGLLAAYNRTDNSRAWYYQTCTEYGFFQTAPKSGTVFDGLTWLNVDFYTDVCLRNFDSRFDKDFVLAAADRVNLVFGGLGPEVNNTINIHGYIDPWRALGVYKEDISETSPTFTVDRFMYNEEFFGGDGSPIFVTIAGDWHISPNWLTRGNMYEMARQNKGYQVYVEHRYYGESQVFEKLTIENLRFLNVNQALADLAYFIGELKRQPRFANSKVILYGPAYAGKLALWFKKRYPHLAVGSVVSSAAILAKVDIGEQLEVVHEAFLLEGGEQCIAHIREGIEETVAALKTESGKRIVEEVYSLCDPLDNAMDLGRFSGIIAWTFINFVLNSRPGQIKDICKNFDGNNYGTTPMQQIAGFVAAATGTETDITCFSSSFEVFINLYMNMDSKMSHRAILFQTCTEFGYFQTAPKSGTVFDDLTWLNIDFYNEICLRSFDKRFNPEFVHAAVDRVNLAFGGLSPEVNNVINIHGYYDPWRPLGVYKEDISETSPTFTVDRASHCFDTIDWEPSDDTADMIAVQQEARRIVASWLSD